MNSQIKDKLKELRPNLSESSLKTYSSILSNLYKKVYPDEELQFSKYENQKKFLTFLKDVEPAKRKTYLSSLVVLCPNCEKYKTQMNQDGQQYNSEQKLQRKTEKQSENWVEQDEIQRILDNLQVEANKVFKLKNPSVEDLQKAQNYILLLLVSGKYDGTLRRSKDWSEMKYKNLTDESNHLIMTKRNWNFLFQVYKTHRFHGDQIVNIEPELKKILTKWIKLLDKVCPQNDYLFIDARCNKLNPTKITQRLNLIFGKKASINILRHSFLSEKYKNMPSLTELQEEAKAMGHSLTEHLTYIKKDDDNEENY